MEAPPPLPTLKAIASAPRLRVLQWLADPEAHFPPQSGGDLVEDGVCADFIRARLGVSAPTATRHLQILTRAGLIRPKPIGRWTYFKRVEPAIERALLEIGEALAP